MKKTDPKTGGRKNGPAKKTDRRKNCRETAAAAAAAVATEHSQDASTLELASQELPADKKIIHSIEESAAAAAAAAAAATEHSQYDSTQELVPVSLASLV